MDSIYKTNLTNLTQSFKTELSIGSAINSRGNGPVMP